MDALSLYLILQDPTTDTQTKIELLAPVTLSILAPRVEAFVKALTVMPRVIAKSESLEELEAHATAMAATRELLETTRETFTKCDEALAAQRVLLTPKPTEEFTSDHE